MQAVNFGPRQCRQFLPQLGKENLCLVGSDPLVVMARIDVPPKTLPMFLNNSLNRLIAHRQDVQPVENGPQPVLFAHMIRPRPGTFFAAQRRLSSVKQSAEILPPRRGFVARDSKLGRHAVDRTTRRHRTGDPRQTCCVRRHQPMIGGNDCQTIAGADNKPSTHNHVAVPVAIRSRTEGQPRFRISKRGN